MLLRTKRALSAGILCALLPTAALEAQTKSIQVGGLADPVPFDASTGYVRHWKYDYATGEITRIALPPKGIRLTKPTTAVPTEGAGDLCFANISTTYFATTHPVTHQELVDWGVKDCGFRCRVTSFTFQYRTGLPQVDCTIAFYVGTTGFGNLGTEVRRFSFQGLPAGDLDEQPDVMPNQFQNTITVDLSSNPMCLPDGPIGWSFTNDDLNSGTFLVEAPNSLIGTIDALDVYDNPPATNGAYVGTFNFASQPDPLPNDVASIQMQIEEEDDPTLAGIQLLQGTGANPIALLPNDVPALGSSWFALPNFSLVPGSNQSTFILSSGLFPPFSTVAGELLIDLTMAPLLVDTTSSFHRVDIPNTLAVGDTFHGQAILFGGGALQLTNGLTLMIGI